MRKLDPTITDKLAALVTTMGYEFVGYEFVQENRNTIFRVYIDCPDGVSHLNCREVSYQIGAMFDVDDPIHGQYVLEVSSPGLNRPLFDLTQYEKQLGRRIKVRLRTPLMQQRNFEGVLQRVDQEQICLLLKEGNEVNLPFSEIEKARVIADVGLKS